ncbi:MAG: hypothetical protein LBR69_02090 [Endomicrobium sp.]|jgi:hypothetical protein|nr:hypothetical protein [Endomicrobium sp.]
MTKRTKQDNIFVLVILGIALSLSAMLLFQLLGDEFLRGSDAYYYALQALSLFKTGEVRIPDSNIIHRIARLLQYSGLSAEMSVKAWTAASYFLFLSSFVLLLKDFKSKIFAVLIFSWAALSPSILFICIELPKTFLFMIFFNSAFYFLKNGNSGTKDDKQGRVIPEIRYRESIFTKLLFITKTPGHDMPKRFALAGFLFICLLIHKMSLVYIGVICFYLFIRNRFDRQIGFKKILIALTTGLLLSVTYKFLIIDHFHISDILRFKSLNFTPGVISLFVNGVLLPAAKAEFIAAAVSAGFLFYLNKTNSKTLLFPLLLMLTSFIPAMDNETLSLGGRFGILFAYVFILSAVYLLEGRNTGPLKNFQMIFICTAVITAGFFHPGYSYPQDYRVKTYEEYEKLISQISGKDIPMLIAHKNFHYYYKYKTGKEAFSYEPEKHWDKKRIWRFVYGATPEELFFYMPEYGSWDSGYILQFPGSHYALVREDCYFDMRKSVQEEKNPELYNNLWNHEINPSNPRPAFLYKKHKEDKNSEFPAVNS